MRHFLAGTLLFSAAGFGQSIVDERQIPPAMLRLAGQPSPAELPCRVQSIKPSLNFSFRYQTGYVLQIPMKNYAGKGHTWALLVRVTPQEGMGQAVYLAAGQKLPEIPKNNVTLEWSGGFMVGPGRYNVDLTMIDDSERVCRSSWRIEAKPRREERDIVPALSANMVDDISLRRTGRGLLAKRQDAPARTLTVLMHASPLSPFRTRLRSYDRLLLLSSLATVLDRLPATKVRVVAFSLDQQKELFRSENLDRRGFDELAKRLDDLELGLIDYDVLKNKKGHVDLLTGLITDEIETDRRSDAVVVLGPTARHYDKVPKELLEEKEMAQPKFFYFQYKPFWWRGADFADTVAHAVKRLGGKVNIIRTPADFGKAIDLVDDATSERSARLVKPR